MKYEKARVTVVQFDFAEFMTGSLIGGHCSGYSDGHGHTCGEYTQGSSCSNFTTTAWGGATCSSYNGYKCYSYTDSSHPVNNPCKEYGYTCSSF